MDCCWNCGKPGKNISGISFRCFDCDVTWIYRPDAFFCLKQAERNAEFAARSLARAWHTSLIDHTIDHVSSP